MDITASVLKIAADWADAIPFAGPVAEAALKGAANLIRTIIAKIQSFISNSNKIDKSLGNYEYGLYNRKKYIFPGTHNAHARFC